MSNLKMKFAVTKADGTVFYTMTNDMPNLDAERLGKVTDVMAGVRKNAKATGGEGDLTLTLTASVDGVSIPDESVKVSGAKLRQVQRAMFKDMLGLLDYEDARAKRVK